MRTTVNIPDHLLVEAKKLAASRKTSLASIVEDSLRMFLAERRARADQPTPSVLPVCDAGKPVNGVDLNDTSELLEA